MLDMMKWLLAISAALGPKLKDAWPHLIVAYKALAEVVRLLNDGQPIPVARSAESPEAQQFADLAAKHGLPQQEAYDMASVARRLNVAA